MNKILPFTVVTGLICLLSYQTSIGQSTCAQTLRTARSTYDQGRLHELPDMLSGCLVNGFTKQEKVEAYKLLVLSYIYLEEPTKADEALLSLLYTDPYFEINPAADPAEFIALYKTFRTWPIYRVGAKVGVNLTQPNVVNRVDIVDGADTKFASELSFQAGATFEIPLNDRLTLNPELYFQQRAFQYDSDLDLGNGLENKVEGTEVMSWISLPVSLQYKIGTSKMNPYISLGVSTDYLLISNLNARSTRQNANSLPDRTIEITDKRNNINVSAIASVGMKRRLGTGYFQAELRLYYGVTKINTQESAFTLNDFLTYDYTIAYGEMKINSMALSIGYVYNVFNPKKLRNK